MSLTKQLIFHGSIILLVGLLCGAPYGRAIVRCKLEATVQAWRLAHLLSSRQHRRQTGR